MFDAPEWSPPEDWPRVETVESHAGGEPLRVVVDGFPPVAGETILEKRRHAEAHLDGLRTALMWEPRGHADMYGAIPVEPERESSDVGVLFTHNQGYSTMCGHGIVALATVLVETGMFDLTDSNGGATGGSEDADELDVRFDTPAGPVAATAFLDRSSDRPGVERVAFENVPSFVYARDRTVDVPGIGSLSYEVAYGGAFYAYCEASEAGIGLEPGDADDLVRTGRAVKEAVAADLDIEHPVEDDLGFLYGAVFTGPPEDDGADLRNVCVFADGEVDRSPTGTGVSGHLALETDRGRLDPGEPFVVESIVGSRFTGRVVERTTCGGYDAVVPEVEGRASVVGRSEFVLDPDDPFAEGFLLR
ncbi:MAG: proline racemase family protein [Haloarculaceae archaeon]